MMTAKVTAPSIAMSSVAILAPILALVLGGGGGVRAFNAGPLPRTLMPRRPQLSREGGGAAASPGTSISISRPLVRGPGAAADPVGWRLADDGGISMGNGSIGNGSIGDGSIGNGSKKNRSRSDSKGRPGSEREWPVRVIDAADGSGRITVVGDGGENGSESGSESNDISAAGSWQADVEKGSFKIVVEGEKVEGAAGMTPDEPSDGGPGLLKAGPNMNREENIEDIASMLLEDPPTLRQFRGGLLSEGGIGLEEQEERARKDKAEAPASLSPNRSILEDYRKIRAALQKGHEDGNDHGEDEALKKAMAETDLAADGSDEPEDGENDSERDESEDGIHAAAAGVEARLPGDDRDGAEEKPRPTPRDAIDDEGSRNKHDGELPPEARHETAGASAGEADEEATGWERELAELEVAASACAEDCAEGVYGGSNDSNDQLEVAASGSFEAPSLETIIGAAIGGVKSSSPALLHAPPSWQDINRINVAANENLSLINGQLQCALDDQRKELGRLRRKISELRGELLRARRARNRDIVREAEARTASLWKEHWGRLAEAGGAIAGLEARAVVLDGELADGRARLDEALEARERIAAEYNYAAKSYMELKRSADSEASEWEARVDESLEVIESLESRLANATSEADRHRKESKIWRDESADRADRLYESEARAREMRVTIDGLRESEASARAGVKKVASAARKEERARSVGNLQRLSDEYELLLGDKSRKIGKLRRTLREANARRRRAERYADRRRAAVEEEVKKELNGKISALKDALEGREDEVRRMEGAVEEAEGAREEIERLSAGLASLTKSLQELQVELAANARLYEECIRSYEREAAEKDKHIAQVAGELEAANEKILQLESQTEQLEAELETEQSLNANLMATVSELQKELDSARANAGGYDDIIAILQKEVGAYHSQLSTAREEAKSHERQRADLEDLISKTRDSLADERERAAGALEEKETHITRLEKELAERLTEVHASEAALEEVNAKLEVIAGKYGSEKDRADALDRKIQKLNQLSLKANDAVSSSREIDRLTKSLEEISKSNDKYKSLVSKYEGKVELMLRQLLLSDRNVSDKQSQIANLKEELCGAVSRAEAAAGGERPGPDEAYALRARLDEVRSKSTVFKAQANGMIAQLTSDLRERDAAVAELQKRLDEGPKWQSNSGGDGDGGKGLEGEIARLNSAMEEARLKARERTRHKNQSIKELEDTVAALTTELENLKREKDQIADRLEEEIRLSEEDFEGRKRRLRQAEDRLAKDHKTAMAEMEDEMNRTIQQLQSEIRSLTSDAAAGMAGAARSVDGSLKLLEVERALRLSKEKEVSLISENLKMQHRIQKLQIQAREQQSSATTNVMADNNNDDDDTNSNKENAKVELPEYYKERQRPVVIRFIGSALKKIFR